MRCAHCYNVWFEAPRETAQPMGASEWEGIGPSLIRPDLNDVVDIGDDNPLHGRTEPDLDGDRMAAWRESGFGRFSDADTPRIDAGPSIVPSDDPQSHEDFGVANNVENAARLVRRRPDARKLLAGKSVLPAVIGVLALTLLGLFAARQQVVRHLPQTASLYAALGLPVNLRGLEFENIKTLRETQDGVPVLIVEGDIVGTTARLTEVPRLRFAVLDGAGREIYAWTARPSRTLLPPGETLPFRSQLASPPAEASSISVRFFNRRDAQAGFI